VNRSVKRIIALTALWMCAAFAIAQAPIGVCLNNVAQTISNGVIAPIPYATVALCSSGSTATNCVANKVGIYTTTALSTATPTNPFTSDAGGNYYFCAHVGHYGLLINSSYGQYFVPDVTLVDDWSAGGAMSGTLADASGFIGPLTGNSATASASNHAPMQCESGLYSQGDTATWAANCTQVLWSQLGGIPALVTSFNTRTGAVTLTAADVDAVGNITNSTSGNAATATALAAAPSVLTSPAVAKGVDAQGNAIVQTFASSLTAGSGYSYSPDGKFEEWYEGPVESSSGSSVTLTLPAPCPNQCLQVFVSTHNASPNDTNMSYYELVSFTNSTVTVFLMRNADHSFDAVSPVIYVIGK
jgi:hypothetical protein